VDDVERYGALVDVEVAAGEASIHSPTFELSRTLAGSARVC
jgi:hypothetical protein